VITSSIADTAASEITSSEPLKSTATDIASTTMIASWGAPVPMKWMITSATASPVTTPSTSCVARWRCCPCEAPIAITAAMQAKTGFSSGSSATHTYHAASAATAVCAIASDRAFSRRRAVVMCISAVIRVNGIGGMSRFLKWRSSTRTST
jgi:hypothetical protein